jgi:pSer/pThr/pTyr-binding forkhead associated (FHA) protein
MAHMGKEEKTAIIRKVVKKRTLPNNIRAVLVVMEGNQAGIRHELTQDNMEIGRGNDVDIRIAEQGISRSTALFSLRITSFYP